MNFKDKQFILWVPWEFINKVLFYTSTDSLALILTSLYVFRSPYRSLTICCVSALLPSLHISTCQTCLQLWQVAKFTLIGLNSKKIAVEVLWRNKSSSWRSYVNVRFAVMLSQNTLIKYSHFSSWIFYSQVYLFGKCWKHHLFWQKFNDQLPFKSIT